MDSFNNNDINFQMLLGDTIGIQNDETQRSKLLAIRNERKVAEDNALRL